MANRSLGFLAAFVAVAAFGGVHLEIASGTPLDRTPGDARLLTGTALAEAGINRLLKADRDDVALNPAERRTITFQHPDLPATTVALRLWETAGAARIRTVPKEPKAPVNKPKQVVACEGVVSVLTEVAKHLEAGRCLT